MTGDIDQGVPILTRRAHGWTLGWFNDSIGTAATGGILTIPRSIIGVTTIGPNTTFIASGFYAAGDDGAGAIYTSVGAGPSGPLAIQDAGGTWFQLVINETVNLGWFGLVRDGVTNNSPALQTAINTYSPTGAVLEFGEGVYIFNSTVTLKPGIILRGAGIDVTFLKIGVDNTTLFNRWGSPGGDTGTAGIEDMTLWGYADRNGFTTNNSKLTDIGPFVDFWFRRVKTQYATNMSITGIGTRGTVEDCIVTKGLRDGINLSGTTYASFINNAISEIADDAIAFSLANGITGVNDCSCRIIGNRVYKSLGFKLNGIRHAVISGNTFRFYTGYAIQVSIDTGFGEGFITKFNISITGNTMLDGIPLQIFGAGDIRTAILFLGSQSLGSGVNAIPVLVGEYRSSDQTIQKPDVFINKAGPTQPRAIDNNITVTGNSVKNTLNGLTNFSDAGFGMLWYISGPVDPAMGGTVGQIHGITIQSDLENVTIAGNSFNGTANGIQTFGTRLRDMVISNNNFFRCSTNGNGITLNANGSTFNGLIVIDSNDFNIDPYLESPKRVTPINGQWTVTSSTDTNGIWLDGYVGVYVSRNRFRNCIRGINFNTGKLFVEKNFYLFDWSVNPNAPFAGIASTIGSDFTTDIAWNVGSIPTSGNFNQFDTNFVTTAGSQPTSGNYRAGTFVRNNNLTIDANNLVLTGWIRLLNGSNHVSGVDWANAYVKHTSP